MKTSLACLMIFCLAGIVGAQHEEGHATAAPTVHAAQDAHDLHAADDKPHPTPPDHPDWAVPVIELIVGMFIAAIPIGMLVRAIMPEEVPVIMSHHEPPGSHAPGPGHGSHSDHDHNSHGQGHTQGAHH